MARTTAPLLSFRAGGQIAKTQVYSSWKGIPYVREYVVPSNPNSSAQQAQRAAFSWLSNMFKFADATIIAPWTAFAKGQPLTNRNAFIGMNAKRLFGQTTMADMLTSPGNGGGVPLSVFTATGSAGDIATAVTLPTLPVGWSVTAVDGLAIPAGDIHEVGPSLPYATFAEQATSTPWEPAWTGLAAGTYAVFAFPKIEVSAGNFIYGPSLYHAATVT